MTYPRDSGTDHSFAFVQVTTHHEDLLVQAAGVSDLEGSLGSVRTGLNELDSSLEK